MDQNLSNQIIFDIAKKGIKKVTNNDIRLLKKIALNTPFEIGFKYQLNQEFKNKKIEFER